MHDVDVNWIIRRGSTPTEVTGPLCDHTRQTPVGHYLYLEASTGSQLGHRAAFVSARMAASSANRVMKFWYHMFGQSIGCLSVEATCQTGTVLSLWRLCGNQGFAWREATIYSMPDIDCGLFEIQFVGERGNGERSDIAIDDISFDAFGFARNTLVALRN